MIIFNYIHEKVLLNKGIKNKYFKAFFLNAILSERTVLEFYFVKHTNILVNEQIQQNELDYSKLRELSSNLNHKKSNKIIELLKDFPLNIILIKELIFELFSFESDTIINPQKFDIYTKNSNKHYIIKSLNTNNLISKIKENNSNNTNEEKNNLNKSNIDDITFLGEYFEKSRLSWWNEDRFFTTVTFVNVSNIDERGQELIELIHKKQVDDPDNDKVENMSELFANYPCYNAVVASYRNDDPKRSGKPSYVIAIRANKVVIKSSDYQYNPEDMS